MLTQPIRLGWRRFALRGDEGPQLDGSSGFGLLCRTDPEFCWRGLQVHKPGVTERTRHGVLPVQKRAKTSVAREPRRSETNPHGNPRSSNSLLESYPPRRWISSLLRTQQNS
jgi:hypothetical protein